MHIAQGSRFGLLEVVGVDERSSDRSVHRWITCRCDCGFYSTLREVQLVDGRRDRCLHCAATAAEAKKVANRAGKAPNHHLQSWAHANFNAAVDAGWIRRAEQCQRCGIADSGRGSTRVVIAHHEDYARPFDVMWLCRKCHGRRHAELRAAGVHGDRIRTASLTRSGADA